MQLGMIGLGRMGANMVRRLMRGGHDCVVFDLNRDNVERLAQEGARGSASLDEFVDQLNKPRVAWVMVPAGGPTEKTVLALADRMEPGDIVIDGGNSYYKDDVRRAQLLAQRDIHFVDVGTSGGIWGVERGYCLMIGGREDAVRRLNPIFKTLAPGRGNIDRTPGRDRKETTAEEGYLYCGPPGAGHFVKMIHNGIEYGLMQAYAEGFDILRGARKHDLPEDHRYDFDVAEVAEVWRRGSVVGSWLLDLTASAMAENPFPTTPGSFRIPVKDDGPSWRRSKRPFRRRRCRPHSMRASARDRSTLLPRRCSRPCATSSADTGNSRLEDSCHGSDE